MWGDPHSPGDDRAPTGRQGARQAGMINKMWIPTPADDNKKVELEYCRSDGLRCWSRVGISGCVFGLM